MICVHCGRQVPDGLPGPIRAKCRAEGFSHCEFTAGRPIEPTVVTKFVMLCKAVARWKLAGSPVRTQQRVDELLAICEQCPHLARKPKLHCGVCGCPISDRVDQPTKNKLALATESCPLDPPRWTADA